MVSKAKEPDRLKRVLIYLTQGEWLVILNDLQREVEQDEQCLDDSIRENNKKDIKFFKDRIRVKNKFIRRVKSKN